MPTKRPFVKLELSRFNLSLNPNSDKRRYRLNLLFIQLAYLSFSARLNLKSGCVN